MDKNIFLCAVKLKILVPTQSSQDKEKISCPFQSTVNFPEWKLAFRHLIVGQAKGFFINLSVSTARMLLTAIN